MSSFEFAFSLFGLLLGLSVAEIMGGFARVMRGRTAIRLGWLTPLLGMLLLVDLVTFWSNAWDMRDAIPPSFGALLYGTVIAAVYYLSASLVFPVAISEWPDLDTYFLRHKAQVMIGVIAANLLVIVARVILFGNIFTSWQAVVAPLVFVSLGLVLILTRNKRVSGAVLCVLLLLYGAFRFLF
ncbi:hypothetical protein OF829_08495 [Sphingomonas sp. LB-2]|uniref:hypothetical protein n=1 Tax=Sphingomonas caeni TaxID=2984949 RepID=UPI00222FFB7A|nr:hypothetical protein [Sphingomonas caeni]MCW3847278.1 hypothetical protein [Sphingomonas caeni]